MKNSLFVYYLQPCRGLQLQMHMQRKLRTYSRGKGLAQINQANAEAFVRFLAADELKGREAGTEEGRIAGNYIASLLQQWGVSPVFDSYFQPFEAYRVERQKKASCKFIPIQSN